MRYTDAWLTAAQALAELEPEGERFAAMLEPFEHMVDAQLRHTAQRQGPRRTRRKRHRQRRTLPLGRELLRLLDTLVLVYGEANAHASDTAPRVPAELIQWSAVRPSTGERFEMILAPRRPLGPNTAQHLQLPAERILAGEPVAALQEGWSRFVRPADVLCGWGNYPRAQRATAQRAADGEIKCSAVNEGDGDVEVPRAGHLEKTVTSVPRHRAG